MTAHMLDPKAQAARRVENFVRYRPGYPQDVLDLLRQGCGLVPAWAVADLGSGTGNLTRLFLEHGNAVFGVEPSPLMREAGERELRRFPRFTSVPGSAERTLLADGSVDLVVAGQAFHRFDPHACKRECQRILRAPRWVALVWNEFQVTESPALAGYEQILRRFAADRSVAHLRVIVPEAVLTAFFAPAGYVQAAVPTAQQFDFAGFAGRLQSVPSLPEPGHPAYPSMLKELRQVFDACQTGGTVSFAYETTLFYGHV